MFRRVSGIYCSQQHVLKCRAVKLAENGAGASSNDVDHEKVSFASKPANACLHFADLGFQKHVATNH